MSRVSPSGRSSPPFGCDVVEVVGIVSGMDMGDAEPTGRGGMAVVSGLDLVGLIADLGDTVCAGGLLSGITGF